MNTPLTHICGLTLANKRVIFWSIQKSNILPLYLNYLLYILNEFVKKIIFLNLSDQMKIENLIVELCAGLSLLN